MPTSLTTDHVVTAWLTAEIDSPRFKHKLTKEQTEPQVRQIITDGTAADRFALLMQARPGAQRFPWSDVTWEESFITNREQLGNMRTCPGIHWLAFTRGTRLLSDAADWIQKQARHLDPHIHVTQTQQAIAKGVQLPPLIGYMPSDAPAPILWEGHVRAVSYYTYPVTQYPLPIYMAGATSDTFLEFDSGLNLEEIRQMFTKGA